MTFRFIILFLFVAQGIKGNEADSLLIRYSDWNMEPSHVSTCSNFEVLNGYEEEFIIPTSSHVDSLKKLLTHLQEPTMCTFSTTLKITGKE